MCSCSLELRSSWQFSWNVLSRPMLRELQSQLILYILFQIFFNRYAFMASFFIDFSPNLWVFFKKEKGAPHIIIVLYWPWAKKNFRLLNLQFYSMFSKKKSTGIHNRLIIHSCCKILSLGVRETFKKKKSVCTQTIFFGESGSQLHEHFLRLIK